MYKAVSLPSKYILMKLSNIPKIKHTDGNNFFLLAGPCAIEGEEMALRIAEEIVSITDKLEIPYVFKKPTEAGSIALPELAMKKH